MWNPILYFMVKKQLSKSCPVYFLLGGVGGLLVLHFPQGFTQITKYRPCICKNEWHVAGQYLLLLDNQVQPAMPFENVNCYFLIQSEVFFFKTNKTIRPVYRFYICIGVVKGLPQTSVKHGRCPARRPPVREIRCEFYHSID